MLFNVKFNKSNYPIKVDEKELETIYLPNFLDSIGLTNISHLISTSAVLQSPEFTSWLINNYLLPDLKKEYDKYIDDLMKNIWNYCFETSCWHDKEKIQKFIIELKYSGIKYRFDIDWSKLFSDFYDQYCAISV